MPSVSTFQPTVTRKGKRVKSRVWWMAWRDPDSGRLVRRSTGAREKSVAKQLAREQERRLLLDPYGLLPDPAKQNRAWSEMVAEFLDHIRACNRPATADAYGISLAHLTALGKPKLVRDVNLAMLQDFAAKRLQKVGPPTVNKDLRGARAALRWAEGRGYHPKCPRFKGIFIREDIKAPVVIPEDYQVKMLAALDNPGLQLRICTREWWRCFIWLARELGARRSELLGISWDRVRLDAREITIVSETSKGRRDRTLPVTEETVTMLREWQRKQFGGPQSLVLPWPKPTHRQFYLDWDQIVVSAGLPAGTRYVPKNFRSTCGSELVVAGTPTVVVKDFLGHSSVVTTERFYTNTQPALRKAVEDRKNGRKCG